ncbi:MAG: hypothetical protein QOG03_1289, partial [Actinomycetota bacterium]|nr:hypothetical protein [Actinomycetota bacterium]
MPAAVLAVTVPLGLVAIALAIRVHAFENIFAITVLNVMVVVGFIAAGLLALRRQPEANTGIALVALGLVFEVFFLGYSRIPWVWVLQSVAGLAWLPVTAWVLLTWPDGRMAAPDRRALAALGGPLVALNVVALVTWNTRDPSAANPDGTFPYPRNPLFVLHSTAASDWTDRLGYWLAVAFLVLLAARLLTRWRRSTPTLRRLTSFVFVVGVAWCVARSIELVIFRLAEGVVISHGQETWVSRVESLIGWSLLVLLAVAFEVNGRMRRQLSRSVVADFVIDVGTSSFAAGDLQAVLAHALGDRDLTVSVPGPGGDWIDLEGRPTPTSGATATDAARAVTTIVHRGITVARLVHDAALPSDAVEAAGDVAGLALANARLHASAQAQLAELRRSRAAVVEATDRASQRIERDLHDGAQQVLIGIGLRVARLRAHADDGQDAAWRDELGAVATALAAVGADLDGLLEGLAPAALEADGLAAALARVAERSPVPLDVECPPSRLPEGIEATIWFLVSEALANAAKPAGATALRVVVTVDDDPRGVTVAVTDDGRGGATTATGSGLDGL